MEEQKKNYKLRDRTRTVLGLFGLVALSACGAAEVPSENVGSDSQSSSSSGVAGCSSGQYSIHGTCVTTSSFLEACQTGGGVPVTVNGIDVCQKTTSYAYPTTYAFGSYYSYSGYWSGSLSGDYGGSNFYGVSTYLNAEAGDKISYRVSGSWGYTTVSSTSVLGGFLSFYSSSTNCRKVDGNGIAYSSSSLNGDGFLVISDGTTTTPIPSSQSSFVATSSGTLKVGFAIDSYYASRGACGSFTVSSLSVTHCEDESGNTQACQ